MEDFYEVNIALNGKHFFATAERSIKDKNRLIEVYNILKEKFPESEGYTISVSKWEGRGHIINMEELL